MQSREKETVCVTVSVRVCVCVRDNNLWVFVLVSAIGRECVFEQKLGGRKRERERESA